MQKPEISGGKWLTRGQPQAVDFLKQSLKRGLLSYAYLFVGPAHVGKMTLALDLARALNCSSEEVPCGNCSSCHRILKGKHADVQIIGLASEVKREIGIEQIKDLQADANLPPYEGKRKVFIIDKAELLSLEAANSLLKILEEPPPQVTFILLSSKEWLLLPTVISRCQRLGLKPLPLNSFKEILEETRQERSSRSLLQEEVELLARLSHGCLGWALLTLEDKQILAERSQRLEAHISLCQANRLKRLAYADELASLFSQNWEKIIEILRLWLDWWHDLVLIKSGVEKFIINIDHQTELQKLARIYQLAEMKQFIIRIQEATKQLEQNANPRLVFEVLLLNMPFRKPSLVGADS